MEAHLLRRSLIIFTEQQSRTSTIPSIKKSSRTDKMHRISPSASTVTTSIEPYSTGTVQKVTPVPRATDIYIHVVTGDGDKAESYVDKILVSVVMVGERGTIERQLSDPIDTKTAFQLGANDTYKFTSSDIGDIVNVKIKGESIGMGNSWFLNEIIIEKRTTLGDKGFKVQISLAELYDWVTKTANIFNIFNAERGEKILRLRKLKEYTESQ